jgi:2-polyprenyl-3-methyl-5-hydroxy-6-metoxy-1,4-benzoquinol methylase
MTKKGISPSTVQTQNKTVNLLKHQIVKEIVPHATYDNGFVINGKTQPYFSFSKPPEQGEGWSDEMTYESKDTAKNHYFEMYNRRLVLEALRPALSEPDRSYIDVGCSSGFLLEDVLNNFPRPAVFGADYFPEGLLHIHEHSPQIPLFQIDLVDKAFTKDKFDAISCLNVLEHVEDDVAALKHLHDISSPAV